MHYAGQKTGAGMSDSCYELYIINILTGTFCHLFLLLFRFTILYFIYTDEHHKVGQDQRTEDQTDNPEQV